MAVSDVVTPNGVGLSPDGSRLYVSETFTGRLRTFEVVGPGKLLPLPDVFQHPAAAQDDTEGIDLQQSKQFWDGLAVDGEGNLVVADLASSGVRVVSPLGAELAFFETPERDLRDLRGFRWTGRPHCVRHLRWPWSTVCYRQLALRGRTRQLPALSRGQRNHAESRAIPRWLGLSA